MISKREKCVGCGSCVQVCPVHAITMIKDTYGFSVASVDQEKCLKCGKCSKVCPGFDERTEFQIVPCFAAQTLDKSILQKSSSGGLFTVLAEEIISRGGVVCGAIQDVNTCFFHHVFAEKIEELEPMRGSK